MSRYIEIRGAHSVHLLRLDDVRRIGQLSGRKRGGIFRLTTFDNKMFDVLVRDESRLFRAMTEGTGNILLHHAYMPPNR